MRDVLDAVAPRVSLLTETNVSHEENISYFGSGDDEAQMVYNFALPPLVLHTFQTGNAAKLTKWTESLEKKSDSTTYLNFLDAHDGIGVSAAKGILSKEEIEAMSHKVREHGGLISRRSNGSGPDEPYEFNITWYSAINREDAGESEAPPVTALPGLEVSRFGDNGGACHIHGWSPGRQERFGSGQKGKPDPEHKPQNDCFDGTASELGNAGQQSTKRLLAAIPNDHKTRQGEGISSECPAESPRYLERLLYIVTNVHGRV